MSDFDGVDRQRAELDGTDIDDEASYVCGSCGELIVVPLDPSAGRDQDYVEDCPVCCCPHRLLVRFERDGSASLSAELE